MPTAAGSSLMAATLARIYVFTRNRLHPSAYGAHVKRVGYRGRLFIILLAFALIPSIVIAVAWSATGAWVFPMIGSTSPWDSAAATGQRAVAAAEAAPLTAEQRQALALHDSTLRTSLLMSRQLGFLFRQASEKL